MLNDFEFHINQSDMETELTKPEKDKHMTKGKRGTGKELEEGDLQHLTSSSEHSVWESSSFREVEVNMAGATKDMTITTFCGVSRK